MQMNSAAMHPVVLRSGSASASVSTGMAMETPGMKEIAETSDQDPTVHAAFRTEVWAPQSSPRLRTPTRRPEELGVRWPEGTKFARVSNGEPIYTVSPKHFLQAYEDFILQPLPDVGIFPWLHGGAEEQGSMAAHYFGNGSGCPTPAYRGLVAVRVKSSMETEDNLEGPSVWEPTMLESRPPHASLLGSLDPEDIVDMQCERRKSTFNTRVPKSNVNLRHFSLQPAKLASVSDIVLYSPEGLTAAVMDVARRIVAARKTMAADRAWPYKETLPLYRVCVITNPFHIAFAQAPKHLISVDENFAPQNVNDLFSYEREEMSAMTHASQIAPNVWLGNSQDVPQSRGFVYSADRSLTELVNEDNPMHFALCVDVHDQCEPFKPEVLQSRDAELVQAQIDIEQLEYSTSRASLSGIPSHANSNADGHLILPAAFVAHIDSLPSLVASDISFTEQQLIQFVDHFVAFVLWLHMQANPPPGSGRRARRILLHCADGYTETSLMALVYIMIDCRMSAPEAYVHLQTTLNRSFFMYPGDMEVLVHIEKRMLSESSPFADMYKASPRLNPHGTGPSWFSKLANLIPLYMIAHAVPEMPARHEYTMSESDMVTQAALSNELPSGNHVYEPSSYSSVATYTTASSEVGDDSNMVPRPRDRGVSESSYDSFLSNASGDTSVTSVDEMSYTKALDPKPWDVLSSSSETTTLLSHTFLSEDYAVISTLVPTGILPRLCEAYQSTVKPSSIADQPWFFSHVFEGHMPSRILPFLYLGNLSHALNPTMASQLGVTHIVSVGESMIQQWPAAYKSMQPFYKVGSDTESKISVLDLVDVADDGIDSIRPFLDVATDYIETARRSGGTILVHCRVGVSRSATVVIAYLMKYLHLSLLTAYSLTRARRLNVLIQPNLSFMATLYTLEADLIRARFQVSPSDLFTVHTALEQARLLGPVPKGAHKGHRAFLSREQRLPWAFLCREISRLNYRFLNV